MLKILIIFIFVSACASEPEGLNSIIDPLSKPVKLNRDTAFSFTEGPVYDSFGVLFFTDGTAGKVFRMDKDKTFTTVITGAGRPDGMMIDPDGNLIVCDYDAKKLDLYSPDGKLIKTLAGSYNGKGLNGPNDVVIDKKGRIYFTDPFFLKPGAPQEVEGVYFLPPGGKLQLICDHMSVPNGIILSPDEKTLLIVDTQEPEIHAIDITGDGKFENHRTWGKVTLHPYALESGNPRSGSVGVAMDSQGNLFVATDLGIEVFNADGKSLGIIKSDVYKRPLNMTFDRNDLYTMIITAYESVYSLKMKVRGISFPQLK